MKNCTKKQIRKFIIEQLVEIADSKKVETRLRVEAFGMLARIFGIPAGHKSGVRARVENGQASPIRGSVRERVEGGSDIPRVPCRD